jgi:hypothetical protein
MGFEIKRKGFLGSFEEKNFNIRSGFFIQEEAQLQKVELIIFWF